MKEKGKIYIIIQHILVWGSIFVFPLFFLNTLQINGYEEMLERTWIRLCLCAFIFYINYFLLVDKLLFTKKLFLLIIFNLVLITGCLGINEWIKDMLNVPFIDSIQKTRMILYQNTFLFVLTFITSITIRLAQNWIYLENDKNTIKNEQLQSELDHLQYQLQPHFFFNSLNTIYSLIDDSPEKAKETVHSLGKLMRYLLYETKDGKVNLTQEIEFIEKFIQLMKIRMSDHIQVNFSVENINNNYKIVPLLFIPLVENAFKHGISAIESCIIDIQIKVQNEKLHFKIQNPNYPKCTKDKSKSGIGLENLKKRLELTYNGKYKMINSIQNENYVSELILSL